MIKYMNLQVLVSALVDVSAPQEGLQEVGHRPPSLQFTPARIAESYRCSNRDVFQRPGDAWFRCVALPKSSTSNNPKLVSYRRLSLLLLAHNFIAPDCWSLLPRDNAENVTRSCRAKYLPQEVAEPYDAYTGRLARSSPLDLQRRHPLLRWTVEPLPAC